MSGWTREGAEEGEEGVDDEAAHEGAHEGAPEGAAPPLAWPDVAGYELHALLRERAATDVFLALHPDSGTYHELIVVRRLAGVDQLTLRQAVEAEVFAAGLVHHVGVVAVHEVGVTGDARLYVATARPAGRLLGALLAEDDALPLLRALCLGIPVIDALAAAHNAGVVHGRLAPDRVVVTPDEPGRSERPIVLGFGTSIAEDGTPSPAMAAREPSPFLAPELAAGAPPTLRSDVFALGSVLQFVIAGEVPPAVHAVEVGARSWEAESEPRSIHDVLQRARAADPRQRYPHAASLGAALRALADRPGHAHPVPLPVSPDATRRAVARRRRRLAAVGGTAVAAGLAVVWAARERFPGGAVPAAPAPVASAPAAAPPVAVAPPPRPAAPPVARPPVVATAAAPAPAGAAAGAPRRADTGRPAEPPARLTVAAPAPRGRQVATTAAAGEVAAASAPAAKSRGPAAAGAPAGLTVRPGVVAAANAAEGAASEGNAEEAVRAVLAEYASAIEARDLGWLGRVYPTMNAEQRRAWSVFFGAVDDLRARLEVREITGEGSSMQAQIRGTYEYQNRRPHRAERSPVSFTATLARGAEGWRVLAVR